MLRNHPAKIQYLPHCRNSSTLTTGTLESSNLSYFQSAQRDENIIFTNRSSRPLQRDDDLQSLQKEHKKLLADVNLFLNAKEVSKHERIRVNAWIEKLAVKQQNPVWKKNVVFYLQVLKSMLESQNVDSPFSTLPPEGPLPKLTIYDIPYPLRSKFSCSKQKSQHSSSRPRQSTSFLKKISKLKGHDFTESMLLDKKTSNPLNKNISFFKIQQDQFGEPQISQPTIKPLYSNTKMRMDNLMKSNSNRISGGKEKKQQIIKKERQSILNSHEDKQNNFNAANVSRQLFASKEKKKQQDTLETQPSKNERDNYNESIMRQSKSQNTMDTVEIEQQSAIYSQMYRLLLQNQSTLSTQPQYQSLVHNIEQIGKKLKLPDFKEDLDSSILSEQSLEFLRASESLKHKFEQTDHETIQFMSFLNKMKGKDKQTYHYNKNP